MTVDVMNLPTLNVIIAGHIDHGKTTLLHTLSGKWTDTHSEELKRGITIKLGYADIILYKKGENYSREKGGEPYRYISFIDAPGHEMLMATMLSGAAIVDAAILVVAANEGIKPQTREHLMALQAKNIKNIIVVQNKIDLVTKEQAFQNYRLLKDFLKGSVAENAVIIPVSGQQGVNTDEIYRSLSAISIPERNFSGEPVFLVARSFDINRPGTSPEKLSGAVLGGTLKQGKLKVGDEIEIKPGLSIKEHSTMKYLTLRTKIKSLYKGTVNTDHIVPGGSVAIETELDMSVGKTDSLSGCVVSHIGKLPEICHAIRFKYKLFPEVYTTQKIAVSLLLLHETLMLSANTSTSVGTVKKIDKNIAEVQLRIPLVPFRGDNIGIARNINGHWRLIGFGEIVG